MNKNGSRSLYDRMILCVKAESIIFLFSLFFLALFRFLALDSVMMFFVVLVFIFGSALWILCMILFATDHICGLLKDSTHIKAKEDDGVTP